MKIELWALVDEGGRIYYTSGNSNGCELMKKQFPQCKVFKLTNN